MAEQAASNIYSAAADTAVGTAAAEVQETVVDDVTKTVEAELEPGEVTLPGKQ